MDLVRRVTKRRQLNLSHRLGGLQKSSEEQQGGGGGDGGEYVVEGAAGVEGLPSRHQAFSRRRRRLQQPEHNQDRLYDIFGSLHNIHIGGRWIQEDSGFIGIGFLCIIKNDLFY